MLFFVTGASGSGKSAIIPSLRKLLPDCAVFDFDHHPIQHEIGGLATIEQRQQIAEAWVRDALADRSRPTIVCGLGVMGEVLACPSAPEVDHMAFCLLDCEDVERLDRLHRRGDAGLAGMDMLCWSAWLRVHHVDPQFRQDVINTGKLPQMAWERWTHWQRGNPHWRCHYLDTTHQPLEGVAEKVADWVRREQALYAGGYRLTLG